MGKHSQKQCTLCKKMFRSDYVSKHMEACKRKHSKKYGKDIQQRKVFNHPGSIRNYLQTEADHSETDSDPEALIIDSDTDDREFINDEQQCASPSQYRRVDNKKSVSN